MSPLLFNMFRSDLPHYLNNGDMRPVSLGISDREKLKTLLSYQILSETESCLNNVLKILKCYHARNMIHIKLDKTKRMIFNKTSRLMQRLFYYEENYEWYGNTYT